MDNTIFFLSSCSTCTRILKELQPDNSYKLQDIKTEKITDDQIDEMAKRSGSYESLFSRRAMKYKSMGLNNEELSEKDYRKLILDEYTFLKRPVFLFGSEIFIGNSKATVELAKNYMNQ